MIWAYVVFYRYIRNKYPDGLLSARSDVIKGTELRDAIYHIQH